MRFGPTVYPSSWSFAQAVRWRDHHVEREPRMLAELATLLRATGGPIEQLDASLDSMVTLYDWWIAFCDAGCPGVPRWARRSDWDDQDEDDGTSELFRRGGYVGQALEHYGRLVVARTYPPAAWKVFVDAPDARGRRDYRNHQTCIELLEREPLILGYEPVFLDPVHWPEGSLEVMQRFRDPTVYRNWVAQLGIESVPGVPVLVSLPEVEIRPPRLGRLAILGPADGPVPEHAESPVARWKPNPRPKIVPNAGGGSGVGHGDEEEVMESWSSDLVEVVKVAERWSHNVLFNDEIAHEREDLIEAYVKYVKRRRWVSAAAWEDREVVVLKARRLSAKTLGQEADQWLREHGVG